MSSAGQTQVVRADLSVLWLEVADDVPAIRVAWADLEERVGTRGRRFVGAFDPDAGWYRACVAQREGDDPESLGLTVGVIPGGRYVRIRLNGEPPAVYDEIAPAYDELLTSARRDSSRPSLEHYRRRDVIDVLMPVV